MTHFYNEVGAWSAHRDARCTGSHSQSAFAQTHTHNILQLSRLPALESLRLAVSGRDTCLLQERESETLVEMPHSAVAALFLSRLKYNAGVEVERLVCFRSHELFASYHRLHPYAANPL